MLFDPSGEVTTPSGVQRVGWSPVDSAADWDAAVLTAEAMVGAARPAGLRGDAAHWNERAGALLACMLHGYALDGRGIDAVVSAVNRHEGERISSLLARHGSELALDLFTGITATDEREQSGIWSTASGILAGYRTRAAIESARLTRLDPAAFVRSSGTLYLASSSEHQQHLAPLVAGLLRDLRSAIYRQTSRSTGLDGTGGPAPQLTLVLDELAGIAPLHDLPTLIAEGAGQGIVTLGCLQDLSQARARWGAAADGFLTLFGTKVILPGVGDTKTLEALSLLAGEHEIPQLSATQTAGLRRSRSHSRTVSTARVRRLPPDAIANLDPGSALVFVGTQPGRVRLGGFNAIGAWRRASARSLDRGRSIERVR